MPSRSPSPVRYGMQWSSGSRARRHASRTATSARCSRTVTCGGTGRVMAVREGPRSSGWACRGAWRPRPRASPGSPQPKARLSLEPQASSTSQARWEPVWRRPARGQASGPEAACPGRPAPAPPWMASRAPCLPFGVKTMPTHPHGATPRAWAKWAASRSPHTLVGAPGQPCPSRDPPSAAVLTLLGRSKQCLWTRRLGRTS